MLKTISISLLALFVITSSVPAYAADSGQIPRTEFGHPDLQGVWFYGTGTPFERPLELGGQEHYLEADAQLQIQSLQEADSLKARPLAVNRGAPVAGVPIAQEADHNFASTRINLVKINNQHRTSQVVSPTNGRLPFREDATDIFDQWIADGHDLYDGPEIRPVSERCAGPNGGPMAPMVSWFYNANLQFFQTEDYVVLLAEMNHDARIIPLTENPLNSEFSQWMGHSTGQWDGDTLIVTTTGFRPEQSWFAFRMSEQLKVIERFKLVTPDEIHYSYTFEDPKIYTKPVTVEKNIVRRSKGENLFEYACHEGNYSYPGILAGARRLELE